MFRRLLDWVHELPFRVATKFALTLTGGALFALAVVVTVLAFHERREVTRAAMDHLMAQGEALAPLLARVWSQDGEARAREMLEIAKAATPHVAIEADFEGAETATTAPSTDGKVSVSVPLRTDALPFGVLTLERPVPAVGAAIVAALKSFLLAAIPLGVFAMAAAYILGEWLVGAPLRRVARHATRVGHGDLDDRLVVRGSAEIRSLKTAINQMSENLTHARATAREEQDRRLDAVNRLRHADRLTTVGTLAAGIAHELGTPLNVIVLEAQVMARQAHDEARVKGGTTLIRNQAGRITTIIRQLLDFARRKAPTRTLADPREVVASCASFVAALAHSRKCSVEMGRCDDDVMFEVDKSAIQQVLTNLFVNAFDAMPDGGRVVARVSRIVRPDALGGGEREWVAIEVEDEGVGMDEETRARVFEPFFTTKDVGRGTGLGLSVALGIAEDHGGALDARPRPGGGTIFTLLLPPACEDELPDTDPELIRRPASATMLASA